MTEISYAKNRVCIDSKNKDNKLNNISSIPKNQQIVLAKHPSGVPTADTFQINDIDIPQPKAHEVLIKSIYVSVDPGMRGFMDKGDDDVAGNKYALNKPITSRTVAQIIASDDDNFAVGDIVYGRFAWQQYQTVSVDDIEGACRLLWYPKNGSTEKYRYRGCLWRRRGCGQYRRPNR